MNGYLSRLISSNNGHNNNRDLRPTIRSQSPIAEHDQRIGLAEFEQVAFGIAGSDTEHHTGEINLDISSAPSISRTTVQRKPAATPIGRTTSVSKQSSKSNDSNNAQTPIAQDYKNSVQSVSTNSSGKNQLDLSNQTENKTINIFPQVNTIQPTAGGTNAPTHQSFSMQPNQQILNSDSENNESQSEPVKKPTVQQLKQSNIVHQYRESTKSDSANTLLPQDRPSPELNSNLFSQQQERTRVNSPTPKVVIDRLNVEVVQPQPIQPSTNQTNNQPLTAAQASVIGPLSGGLSAAQRLSLRHR